MTLTWDTLPETLLSGLLGFDSGRFVQKIPPSPEGEGGLFGRGLY